MRRFTKSARQGFFFMAALGLVIVLGIVVMSGAESVQVTWSTVGHREQERRLTHAIEETAALVAAGGMSEITTGSASAPVALLKAPPESISEPSVQVVRIDPQVHLLGKLIALREGDVFVRIDAAIGGHYGGRRSSTFLVNLQGKRHAPILLEEKRS